MHFFLRLPWSDHFASRPEFRGVISCGGNAITKGVFWLLNFVGKLNFDGIHGDDSPKVGPRLKGKRLPNLEKVLVNSNTQWEKITLNCWYGEGERKVEICTGVAVWYHTGLPVVPIRWVLVRDPLGKFESQALLCTQQEYSPSQILEWFVRRWQMEVTFEEARAHLGMETQRQWSDLAIARTTPILLGLFSLVTILAHHLQANFSWKIRQTIWYSKPLPTFSDALALARRFLWATTFSISPESTETIKVPRSLFERLRDIAVYAA